MPTRSISTLMKANRGFQEALHVTAISDPSHDPAHPLHLVPWAAQK